MKIKNLKWLADLSIQGRFTLLVSVSTAFFLLFFIFSTFVSERGISNLGRVDGTVLPMVTRLHQVELQFLRLRDAFNEAVAEQDADALADARRLTAALQNELHTIAAQEAGAAAALAAFTAYTAEAGELGTAAVNGSVAADQLYAAITTIRAREDNFRKQFTAFRNHYLGQVNGWVAQSSRDGLYLWTIGLVLGVVALGCMLLLGWWIARSVRTGLQEAVGVAEAIAGGNWDVPVNVTRRDETGQLLTAIHSMRATLQERLAADQRREARTTILVELGERMRGQLSPPQLCTKVLGYLVEVTRAPVGVMYIFDKDTQQLVSAATYATASCAATLRLGEGLAGQVAAERRLMVVDRVPEGYLTISSGVVAVAPQQIILLPIAHNDQLVGILELALVTACDEACLGLLQECMKSVAVSLMASVTYALLVEMAAKGETLR